MTIKKKVIQETNKNGSNKENKVYLNVQLNNKNASLTEKQKIAREKAEKELENNYYDILKVKVFSGQSEIKEQYKKMLLKYHPDKENGSKEKFLLL